MGQRPSGQRPISLVIPCQAEYFSLCRLVAGVVGARESLDEEDVADLKLVVTEACTCFLWGPDGNPPAAGTTTPISPPCSLQVDFVVLPAEWTITISDSEHRYRIPDSDRCDPSAGGLGLQIIRALADSVEHTCTEAEGSIIRLVKRLAPRPAHGD
jgi:anti-sigma regulatory factor (Ser/Thr protein kinase)